MGDATRVQMKFALSASVLLLAVETTAFAAPQASQSCLYVVENGTIKSAKSLNDIPAHLRQTARCSEQAEGQSNYLAPPQDITLKGAVLEDTISSPLGTVHLRGARSVQKFFGRSPVRAISEAARTVNKVLQQASFPAELQKLNLDWQVVFLDENLPETEIPRQLISNCHPGWMTPPGNIYLVTQKIAQGCSGNMHQKTSDADAELMGVMLHEMGHAVEAALLGRSFAGDRRRAEGFATWFEGYAADFSSLTRSRRISQQNIALGRLSLDQGADLASFNGTAEDYARASMVFEAITARRGVRGLFAVYEKMRTKQLPFPSALNEALGWNDSRLLEEVKKLSPK